MERPLFFQNEQDQLFGVLHIPDGSSPRAGMVLCHAFGEEKLWSHRVYVNLARQATERGLAVLRFDFRGHGDSSGQSEDNTLDDYSSDIAVAINRLQSEFPEMKNIGLVGLRFGASLAWLHAGLNDSPGPVVLWEPVMQGKRYMQELLRINLSTQLAIYGKVRKNREALVAEMQSGISANVDGYLISHKFYEDCIGIELLKAPLPSSDTKALVVQIAPNISQKDRTGFLDFAAIFDGLEFLKIEEPPFWREVKPFTSRTKNLIGETLDWWEKQIAD